MTDDKYSVISQLNSQSMSSIVNSVDNMIKYTKSFTDRLEGYKNLLQRYMQRCEVIGDTSHVETDDLKLKFAEALASMNNESMKFFKLVHKEENTIFGATPNLKSVRNAVIKEDLKNSKDVQVKVHDGCLYVKLPRVPIKYYIRSFLYCEELNILLKELAADGSLPIIENKDVLILHVFHSDYNRIIPDNDNYDFKAIIDTITDYLSGGDGGLNCWYRMCTVINDNVPAADYIIIRPRD